MDTQQKHKLFEEVKKVMEQGQRFLVLSPGNIDGDCMGANVVLYKVLKDMGKEVEHICFRDIPEKYEFYPYSDVVGTKPHYTAYDAVFITDTAEKHLLAVPDAYAFLVDGSMPVINIDHHVSNSHYGTLNIVYEACSASFMVMEMLEMLQIPLTQEFATALLAGIYFDTGGLMHNNSTPEVFAAVSRLFKYNPDVQTISDAFFRKTSVSKLRLWGRVFEKAQLTEEGVLMSAIIPDDFETCEASKDDLDGAVEYLNYVPEKKFSMLMYDTGQGKVKGSFRTQETSVDVNKIAQTFGGGGHKMAAGFMVPGRLQQEVRWKISK